MFFARITGLALALCLSGCSLLPDFLLSPRSAGSAAGSLDGTTQTTPVVGRVEDAQGKPVAGATVVAYVAPQLALEGVTQTTPFDGTTQTTPLETRTDEQGKFGFANPPTGTVTFEAAARGQKAIRMSVQVVKDRTLDLGVLRLAQTGALRGRVIVPEGESPFGIDIFVPGTRIVGKTDESGAYVLTDVAPAAYRVAATKERYARAVSPEVELQAGQTAMVPDLVLTPDFPVLSSLSAPALAVGQTLTLRGEGFGHGRNLPFEVLIGTLKVSDVQRISDTEIRAVVPAEAANGLVSVVVNGVASPGRPFKVIRSLQIEPSAIEAKIGTPRQLEIRTLDADGQPIAGAPLEAVISPPDLGSLTGGAFTATAPGTGSLAVSLGNLTATASLATGYYFVRQIASVSQPRQMAYLGGILNVVRGPAGTVGRLEDGNYVPWIGQNTAPGDVNSPSGTLAADFKLESPEGLRSDGAGNLYLYDGSGRVLVYPAADGMLFGKPVQSGRIYNLRGPEPGGTEPPPLIGGLARDGDSLLVAVDGVVKKLGPDGSVSPVLGGGTAIDDGTGIEPLQVALDNPSALALDRAGNVLVGDASRVWMLCRQSGQYFGRSLTAGKVYILAGSGQSGNGPDGPAREVALKQITGLLSTSSGLLLADFYNHRVRRLDPDGTLRTVVGGGTVKLGAVDFSSTPILGSRAGSPLGPWDIIPAPDGSVLISLASTVGKIVRLE